MKEFLSALGSGLKQGFWEGVEVAIAVFALVIPWLTLVYAFVIFFGTLAGFIVQNGAFVHYTMQSIGLFLAIEGGSVLGWAIACGVLSRTCDHSLAVLKKYLGSS